VTDQQLSAIASLITEGRSALLTRWREEVRKLPAAEDLDEPTLTNHVPHLLDELAEALRSDSQETITSALKGGLSPVHGTDRFAHSFDVEEVVAEYNILRTAIHDMVEEHGLRLQGEPFRVLNRVLDGAIGAAVKAYTARQALEVKRQREDYLAFVAHDLRAPLHSLSMATTVLELTLPDETREPETSRLLEMFRRNIENLDGLAEAVVRGSVRIETRRGRRAERRKFALFPLVEAVLHGFAPVARVGSTDLRNDVPEGLEVEADALLLSRIFQNLVANALTHAQGAQVTVGAIERTEESMVECWVHDTGAGIPQKIVEQMFEASSTSEPESHSGLGLAIVRRFVEAHGGEVTVESEEKRGSTFRFTLPRQSALRGRRRGRRQPEL